MFFFFLWGFGLWLEATLALRVAGQFFFNPNSIETLLLTFALTVPLIAIATYPVYRARKLEPSERLVAAVYMVLPGMLCNTRKLNQNRIPSPSITAFVGNKQWGR